ncbi:MAG: glycosyltransferase [Synechococcaceae cyanobacterium]|nr:glycosyltransferase [Synechococcaceae cyanobacterium]
MRSGNPTVRRVGAWLTGQLELVRLGDRCPGRAPNIGVSKMVARSHGSAAVCCSMAKVVENEIQAGRSSVMTLVSVIVRTLGRARIAEALASIANQRWADVEVVVIDMSRRGMASFVRKYPRRIQTVEVGRPLNRSLALNLAIQHCQGDLIGILDDDNLYLPSHIEHLVNALGAAKADMAYTGILRQTLTPEGRLIHEETMDMEFSYRELLSGNYIYASGVLFTKRIWQRIGGYDERFPIYEDWDFYIRLGNAGKICHVNGSTAISRNFTGIVGSSSHTLETSSLRRCYQGVLWTHRKLRRLHGTPPQQPWEKKRNRIWSWNWSSLAYQWSRSRYRELRSGAWESTFRNVGYLLSWQVEHGIKKVFNDFWTPLP